MWLIAACLLSTVSTDVVEAERPVPAEITVEDGVYLFVDENDTLFITRVTDGKATLLLTHPQSGESSDTLISVILAGMIIGAVISLVIYIVQLLVKES